MKRLLTILFLFLPFTVFSKGNSVQFIENRGQITDQHYQPRPDIDAKIESNGVTLFIGNGEMHYQWMRSQKTNPDSYRGKNQNSKEEDIITPLGRAGEESTLIYRMDVVLVGANKNVRPIFEEATGYKEHYYNERSGEEGIHAEGYGRIVYKNIYPNIDWVIYTAPP